MSSSFYKWFSNASNGRITFETLERLEKLREGLGSQLLVILGGHLDADLKVLPDVSGQHGSQTLQRVFH